MSDKSEVAAVEIVSGGSDSRMPMAVEGTWEAARTWLQRTRIMAEGALFCQVMTGLELLHLRDNHGETRGRPGKKVHGGGLISFSDLACQETGLGRSTVFKLIEMASSALPRLRKLPGLRGFDPTTSPVGLLSAPQQEALTTAVHKLTDGLSQADFLAELGLAKMPQGSGATGGARNVGPQEKLSSEEKAKILAQAARDEFACAVKAFETSKARFTLLPDSEVRGQIEYLRRQVHAREIWLRSPEGSRDPAKVKAALAGGQL